MNAMPGSGFAAGPAAIMPQAQPSTSGAGSSLDNPGLRTIMRSIEREQGSSARNSSASLLSRRLAAVLAEATGESKLTTAGDWWKWWYNENECLPPIRAYRVSCTPDLPPGLMPAPAPQELSEEEYRSLEQGPPPPYTPRACECFAAGTPVWTETGRVAVEKIRMGDRVFSCDPETGCLALKVVLRPTVRRQINAPRPPYYMGE
jgi:hypothetical protein